MTIASIIRLGYGDGVQFIATLGYASGGSPPAPITQIDGGDWFDINEYRNQLKKAKKRLKAPIKSINLKRELEDIYNEIHDLARPSSSIQQEAKELVDEFVAEDAISERWMPPAALVDFDKLAQNIKAVERMIALQIDLYNEMIQDEEEALLMLLE